MINPVKMVGSIQSNSERGCFLQTVANERNGLFCFVLFCFVLFCFVDIIHGTSNEGECAKCPFWTGPFQDAFCTLNTTVSEILDSFS